MKRREFFGAGLGIAIGSALPRMLPIAEAQSAQSIHEGAPTTGARLADEKKKVGPVRYEYPRIGPPWPKSTHPAWLRDGLVFVGDWEPLPWEYRKNWQDWSNALVGDEAASLHRVDRSADTADKLKAMGVNMVVSCFHKGFGIINEKDTMEEARSFAKVLHARGMKLGVLVSTLLMYEDLYGEIPESQSWHRVLYDGQPDTYGNDGFRYRVYLNHPAYINYMKKVCELAIDYGIDAIFFDTVRQQSENHHPLALDYFRQWLKAKYPTDREWYFRTGLHYRDFIKIPHIAAGAELETLDQGIIQEYQHFKTQQYAEFTAEMKAFIQKKSPEVALWLNTGGVTGANVIDRFNTDHAQLMPSLDLYYTEDPDYARVNEHGGIVSKIRAIKAGSRLGVVHTNAAGHPPPSPERSLEQKQDDPRLRLAEAMAFNRLSLGNMGYGGTNVLAVFPEEGRKYIRFYRDNFKSLLADCDTATDIAVLRTFTSMAFSQQATHKETVLAEQGLIQSQVPYDTIYDDDLKDLAKYKVVVLANQECLSDAQVSLLQQYVRGGGSLVATGDTSMYNEWRRQRPQFGLAEVFGIKTVREGGDGSAPIRHEYGKGRATYLRHLISAVPVPRFADFTLQYHAPPKNQKQFLEAVTWARGGSLMWDIEAPPYVAAEAYRQSGTGRYILHLVNYDCWKQPTVQDIKVALSLPDNLQLRSATLYSPDTERSSDLRLRSVAGKQNFTVPSHGIYSIITLEK